MGFLKAATFSTDCSAMLAQKNSADPCKQETTVEMSNKSMFSFLHLNIFVILLTSIEPYRNTPDLKSRQKITCNKRMMHLGNSRFNGKKIWSIFILHKNIPSHK